MYQFRSIIIYGFGPYLGSRGFNFKFRRHVFVFQTTGFAIRQTQKDSVYLPKESTNPRELKDKEYLNLTNKGGLQKYTDGTKSVETFIKSSD